jgi:hypothetical protein
MEYANVVLNTCCPAVYLFSRVRALDPYMTVLEREIREEENG